MWESDPRDPIATAKDWQMAADMNRQLKFPDEIVATTSRPDIVVWSTGSKQVGMLELTVPWEEKMEDSYKRKRLEYQQLVEECQENGWKTW